MTFTNATFTSESNKSGMPLRDPVETNEMWRQTFAELKIRVSNLY